MKFEKIKPGMVLYDVRREKMGNTMMSTVDFWRVHVISVDADTRSAMVSWNGNKATRWYRHTLEKLREKEPLLIDAGLGKRLATREEIKAAKAKEQ